MRRPKIIVRPVASGKSEGAFDQHRDAGRDELAQQVRRSTHPVLYLEPAGVVASKMSHLFDVDIAVFPHRLDLTGDCVLVAFPPIIIQVHRQGRRSAVVPVLLDPGRCRKRCTFRYRSRALHDGCRAGCRRHGRRRSDRYIILISQHRDHCRGRSNSDILF